MVTVLSSGTLMGGFGVFAINTPAADANPGGGSGNDHDHDHGLAGAIHKITGGLFGGGVGGGGGPGSGGTRSAPSSPSFGKSLHGASGSDGAEGGSSSDSDKGKGDKDKGPGANVPKPGSAGANGKSSDNAAGTPGAGGSTPNSTNTNTTGTGIGVNLPHSGGAAGVHTGTTPNVTSPSAESLSAENPRGTTTQTEEHPSLKGALGAVTGALAPKTQTATTPKTDTATSPHTATAPGATADSPASGSTQTEHEASSEEPKVPSGTVTMGGRTIVIWKKKPSTAAHTPGAGGGTTPVHESEGDHDHVITLPGLPNIGGLPNPDAPSGGAAGTRPPSGNPGIHTGPISPPTVPTPKTPAVAIATPPAPPVIAPLSPVVPPAPPVVTIKQVEAGRGGDVVVTAGGDKRPEAVTKPIEQFVAAETIAPRTGYGDYLRLTKTSEIAAMAIPGAAGIAMMTFIGAALGYRQAKAGHTVRASAAARFLE
ncbi:hypothetical protein [Mycobacteroides sp. LB1]|uniref:hypothetical protein n=1 Tax=Mycobacteroides sp. LB1 TaxID=2750814 RepID=UPI0015DDF1EF|nr:hypothetical protein [Mycobacteroides sp. LB1]